MKYVSGIALDPTLMKNIISLRYCLLLILLLSQGTCKQEKSAPAVERPNIIIMADDLGYSDPGCYGGEIETPNLDMLAETGMLFTQMYNCARCCPTCASLMTGKYQHQVCMALNGRDLQET
jgi:hypothetical protein